MMEGKAAEILSSEGLLPASWRKSLEGDGHAVREYGSGAELLGEDLDRIDLVLVPDKISDAGGLELIEKLQRKSPRLPVVMLTKETSSEGLIEAVKRGAYDCLSVDVDSGELLAVVDEALEAGQRMQRMVTIGVQEGDEDSLVGRSREMLRLYKELGRLSATPVTVLIQGETGTGKELIARALYQHGHRAHKPFIAVNCAAIPENLLESELFGHEKGAFTGAVATRIGKFEQAHQATLFLDEIGDLDLSLQAKLLRVLQERQIQRVGGRELIPVDVRVIAATHRDLQTMIADGTFREDLFYRLNVASIHLPALRDRDGDVRLLTEHFLGQFVKEMEIEKPSITVEAIKMLEAFTWPGNVRQLQNILRKALLEGRTFGVDEKTLGPLLEDVPQLAVEGVDRLEQLILDLLARAQRGETQTVYADLIATVESELLAKVIEQTGGNQAKAARWLGITRYTLREKLSRYGLRRKGR